MVEGESGEANWDTFRETLINAKSKDKAGKEGPGPRYAVYDVEYDAPGGEGKRYVALNKRGSPLSHERSTACLLNEGLDKSC